MSFKVAILLICLSATAIKGKENFKKCPTDTKFCGPNAECYDNPNDDNFKKHQGAYCQCDEGFVGPPLNCRFCDNGRGCGFDYFCNKDKKCQKKCTHDSCPKNHFCNYFECVPGCNEDYQCGDDEYCHESNTCKKGCRESNSCPELMACNLDTRKCIKGCSNDESCNDDEYCRNYCRKGCREYNCPKQMFCDIFHDRKCVEGCWMDENCYPDEYCERSVCKKGCRESNCPKENFCKYETKACVPGCEHDHHCEVGEYCKENSKCQKICDDFPCGDNSVCGLKKGVKRCSCADGYRPVKGKECVKNNANNENLSCDESCGENSKCSQDGDKTFCYCKDSKFKHNPLTFCQSDKPHYPIHENWTSTKVPVFRPSLDNQISCAVVACFSAG